MGALRQFFFDLDGTLIQNDRSMENDRERLILEDNGLTGDSG